VSRRVRLELVPALAAAADPAARHDGRRNDAIAVPSFLLSVLPASRPNALGVVASFLAAAADHVGTLFERAPRRCKCQVTTLDIRQAGPQYYLSTTE
jgi:hypothetical protein